ncbi:MAG: hypothetical protein J0H84_26630 [Rhizobiales bacterium]|nr:hypothetical protein [Hyphomicrobiales bacterium]
MGKHRKPDIPDALRPYEEGYRKPPRKNQFKVGNNANPKGRPPKKAKTVGEQLEEILLETVEVAIGGRTRSLTQQQVILRGLIVKAAKGDVRAAETVWRLQRLYHDDPARSIDPDRLEESDRNILERYFEDLARGKKSLDGSYPDEPQGDK